MDFLKTQSQKSMASEKSTMMVHSEERVEKIS